MSPLAIVTTIADVLVSTGAGAVVGNAIKMTTPRDASKISKISIAVGGFVLSGMVGTAASKYAATEIQAVAGQVQNVKAAFSKAH